MEIALKLVAVTRKSCSLVRIDLTEQLSTYLVPLLHVSAVYLKSTCKSKVRILLRILKKACCRLSVTIQKNIIINVPLLKKYSFLF